MANGIPEVLIGFKAYREGDASHLYGMTDIELPELTPLTDKVKGAGINGEYEAPILGQFQSMKTTLKFRNQTREFLELAGTQIHKLDLRGSLQIQDEATAESSTRQVRVVLRGRNVKQSLGKLEGGAVMDGSVEIEATYLKVVYDKETMIEVDKLNGVYRVGGVDQLADYNRDIG